METLKVIINLNKKEMEELKRRAMFCGVTLKSYVVSIVKGHLNESRIARNR
jgi:hypothetical protein